MGGSADSDDQGAQAACQQCRRFAGLFDLAVTQLDIEAEPLTQRLGVAQVQ